MNKKVRIFYLPSFRNSHIKPEVTLAIRETNNRFEIGFAICSEEDMFEKKIGRELAIKRLNTIPLPFNLLNDVVSIVNTWDKHYAPVSADTVSDLYKVFEKVNGIDDGFRYN